MSPPRGFGCPHIHTIYTETSAPSTLEKLLTFWKRFVPESILRTGIKTLKKPFAHSEQPPGALVLLSVQAQWNAAVKRSLSRAGLNNCKTRLARPSALISKEKKSACLKSTLVRVFLAGFKLALCCSSCSAWVTCRSAGGWSGTVAEGREGSEAASAASSRVGNPHSRQRSAQRGKRGAGWAAAPVPIAPFSPQSCRHHAFHLSSESV